MAMIDYGAIAFKNGKKITHGMFTPMKEMIGWEDTEEDTYYDYETEKVYPLKLVGNFFAYIGDEEKIICFYKEYIKMVSRDKTDTFVEEEWFNWTHYKWYKWEKWLGFNKIKVTKRNGYYVLKWKYKGDKYKVYFGYGVDNDLYDKTKIIHFVNYFRLPQHIIKNWVRDFKNWIKDEKLIR